MIDLTVVIPVRDEEEVIPLLVERLLAVLLAMEVSHEIIFVTDVNTDRTWEVLKEQRAEHPVIKLLKLSSSFGHHVAVIAGLRASRGECALVMDGDLEMLPEEIPKLYQKYESGFDVVYGKSRQKNRSPLKDFFSRLFNRVLQLLADEKMEHNTDMFRLLSRRTINAVLKFGEHQPSLTHIVGLINFPTAGVEVEFARRAHGTTKYSFWRQLNFALNSVISFSTKPIRTIVLMGLLISSASFVFLIVVLVQKVFVTGYDGLGMGTVVVLVTFFGGLQLLAIGMIGEYLGRTFIEAKGRPQYIVDEELLD